MTPLHILSPTSPKKAHHILFTTVSHLPMQEPTGVTPKASNPVAKEVEQALEAASPASEKALPANMQPLCIQLGASKACTDARLKVAKRDHQPLIPQSAHMCAECTWGWGWCFPLMANHSSTWTHSGTTRKVTLICKYSFTGCAKKWREGAI